MQSRVSKKVAKKTGTKKKSVTKTRIDDDEIDEVEIMSHWKGKDGIFELHVFYPEEDEKQWEKLCDMWHDYPDEVTMYRRKHSLKTKYWRTPVSTEGDEVV